MANSATPSGMWAGYIVGISIRLGIPDRNVRSASFKVPHSNAGNQNGLRRLVERALACNGGFSLRLDLG